MVASAKAHCQHRCLYHPSRFKNGRRECQLVRPCAEPGGKLFSFLLGASRQVFWSEYPRLWTRLDFSSEARNSEKKPHELDP